MSALVWSLLEASWRPGFENSLGVGVGWGRSCSGNTYRERGSKYREGEAGCKASSEGGQLELCPTGATLQNPLWELSHPKGRESWHIST